MIKYQNSKWRMTRVYTKPPNKNSASVPQVGLLCERIQLPGKCKGDISRACTLEKRKSIGWVASSSSSSEIAVGLVEEGRRGKLKRRLELIY